MYKRQEPVDPLSFSSPPVCFATASRFGSSSEETFPLRFDRHRKLRATAVTEHADTSRISIRRGSAEVAESEAIFGPLRRISSVRLKLRTCRIKRREALMSGVGPYTAAERAQKVRMRGFEPPRDYLPLDPESSASANSATSACESVS